MLLNRQTGPPAEAFECGTLRQHFNHLRNSSLNMRNILSWGTEDQTVIANHAQHSQPSHPNPNPTIIEKINDDAASKQKRNVSFDVTQATMARTNPSPSLPKKAPTANPSSTKAQERPRSASTANKKPKNDEADEQLRRSIRER